MIFEQIDLCVRVANIFINKSLSTRKEKKNGEKKNFGMHRRKARKVEIHKKAKNN